MGTPEESFARSLDTCESLLQTEKEAIESVDVDAIESVLSKKDDAFEQLRKAGETLGYSPTDRPEFTSRIEAIFAEQQANLECMQVILTKQRTDGEDVREGQARLRMLKGAYQSPPRGLDR